MKMSFKISFDSSTVEQLNAEVQSVLNIKSYMTTKFAFMKLISLDMLQLILKSFT